MSESPIATSGSHTATEQWQSFEMRMRRRRAERCLLRAEAAIDADFLDDAQLAIDEAAGLTPNDPAVARLIARLAEARLDAEELRVHLPDAPVDVPLNDRLLGDPAPTPPAGTDLLPIAVAEVPTDAAKREAPAREETRNTRRTRWPLVAAAVMALMLAGSGTVAWYWTHASRVSPYLASSIAPNQRVSSGNGAVPLPATDRPVEQPVAKAPPAPSTDSVEIVSTDVAAGTVGRESNPIEREPEAPEPVKREADTTVASTNLSAPARGSGGRDDEPVGARNAESTPPPPVVSPTVQPALSLPEPVSLPAAPIAAVADIPAPRGPAPDVVVPAAAARDESAPSPVAVIDREQLVRAALTRYENAYSTLNAAAASAVWPSVDQRALARAFEDLSSQSVTLGRCAVRMNGGVAQAECAGNASWTPKVGGGRQTAARRWRFELKQNGNDWVIVRAAVR